MNVLIFAGHAGSILQFNKELVMTLIEKKHTVYCVGPEEKFRKQFEEIGAKFETISFNRYSINPLTAKKVIDELTQMIKRLKIDAYYGFTAMPVTYGVIAAHRANVPHIFAALTGAGKVVQNRKGLYNKAIRLVLSTFMKHSLKYCEKVFFLNYDNLNYFVDHKLVKKEQCVKVNGSGVNTAKFTRSELPSHMEFLFVGALLKLKGIIEYMEAARIVKSKYPDVVFTVVGGYDTRLSAITEEDMQPYINDGTINYVGFQKNVKDFVDRCRVFVLPSYSEGIPTCVIEAMSVGRAIITTDAPGCRETVVDGKNGFLIPVNNIEVLAEKMIWTIEHPETINKMADESRKMAEDIFDVYKVNEVMLKEMGL